MAFSTPLPTFAWFAKPESEVGGFVISDPLARADFGAMLKGCTLRPLSIVPCEDPRVRPHSRCSDGDALALAFSSAAALGPCRCPLKSSVRARSAGDHAASIVVNPAPFPGLVPLETAAVGIPPARAFTLASAISDGKLQGPPPAAASRSSCAPGSRVRASSARARALVAPLEAVMSDAFVTTLVR